MTSNPRISRFQSAVKKFIVEKVQGSEDEESVSPSPPPKKISRPAPRKATTMGFVPNEPTRLPLFQRQQTLAAQFINNMKANKEIVESSPSQRRTNKLKSLVSVFMKAGKKQSPVAARETLSIEDIKKKFSRAFQILRVIHRLNRISEDIQLYGTSSNLFDLTTRDRTRVKKILYPSVLNEHEEQLNEEKGMKWYVVHPKSRFRVIWSIVIVILLLYTATIMPYRLTFESSSSTAGEAVDYTIDGLFLIDLILNFVSAYYDDEGKLVKEPRILMGMYLKSWFIIDLVAVFPFDLIQDIVINEDSDPQASARFSALIRLFRLPRLYKLVRLLKIKNFFKFLRGTQFIEWIELHSVFVKLFGFLIGVVALVHIMACIWYFMARMDSDNPATWVARERLSETSTASIYLMSLYYIFSTLATVGYGDISSGTIPEQVFSIILMLLGVAIYSFTIGMTASLLSSRENRESALKRKVSIANEFAHEIKTPRALKDRITKILEYNSFRNCFSWANKKDIFSEIPITLRYEIVMTMHNGILNSIPFFREHSDKYFVVTIAEILKPLRLKARSYLWSEGDSSEAMYFLITGKVHLISYEYLSPGDRANNQKTAIIFKRFMAGSYFGETELINKRKRSYSLQVNSESELFYLTKHDYFSVIVAEFPHIHEEFKEIATERDRRNGESLIEIRKYLQANLPEERKSIRVPRLSLKPTDTTSGSRTKPNLKHAPSIELQANLERILNLSSDQKDHIPEIKLKNLVTKLPPLELSGESKLKKTPSNHSNGSLSPPAMSRKRLEEGIDTERTSLSPSRSLSKILYSSSGVSSEENTDVKSRSESRSQSPAATPTTPKAKKSILKKKDESPTPKSGAALQRTYSFSRQNYHRSKTTSVVVVPDSGSGTKKKSIRLSAHLKPGTVLSSVDLDNKKRKGSKSKERSLLKLIVGAESESDESSSRGEAVGTLDKLGSQPEFQKGKGSKGSTTEKEKGSSKKEERDGLVEIEKMKKRGRKRADGIRSDLKESSHRMKGLEKQLGKLMEDVQELMDGS